MVDSGMRLIAEFRGPRQSYGKSVLGNHLPVLIPSWPEATLSQSWLPPKGLGAQPQRAREDRGLGAGSAAV